MSRWLCTFGFLVFVLVSQPACSSVYKTDDLLDGKSLQPRAVGEVVAKATAGSVVVVSESHGFQPHHDKQMVVLESLLSLGRVVNVAMEFFDFTQQQKVDDYLAGALTESDFLRAVNWGQPSFDFYRRQTRFPLQASQSIRGRTLAINAPRSLTAKIAHSGLSSLSADEQALLPPAFSLGNAGYRARFNESMAGHADAAALDRYFEAQSVWDDTMAYRVAEFHLAHPGETIVIIVGDFHAAYFGGLPDRLRTRGVADLVVISQVNLSGGDDASEHELVDPSPTYGPRADYVWVSR